MAVDYGRARVGIALSDALQMTAQPYSTIEQFKSIDALTATIINICTDMHVQGMVVGLPINMDGTEGEMATEVRKFVSKLVSATKIPVVMLDERLTSRQAKRVLVEAGIKSGKAKGKIDQVAAAFILRSYLDRIIK